VEVVVVGVLVVEAVLVEDEKIDFSSITFK
jgi:hypothetical protein